MKALKISKEISLPLDIVTQTIAILAKRRAGKSYTMRKQCEELLKADQQIVIVDPKGDQWGIRSSADGKKAGFPIIILGGEHGDLPLEVNAGEVVAKLVVEERVSILIDLSEFRKHEIATFMAIFLENLYRLKAQEQYRTPVMLVVDEADAIAPQKPQKGEERMLGAIEDIVRRGGQRGIGCTLVTQRSAVLNKNVLTQAQMLIVLRTIAPQDIAAMKAWIDVHGTIEEGKELIESLPSLPVGDAWFWSPGWPTEQGIFQRTHVLPIETFDSGATPKPGARKVIPKTAADVDLKALQKQMADTIERKKADDPKELKKEIASLKKLLVAKNGTLIEKQVPDQRAIVLAVEANNKDWQKRTQILVQENAGLKKILQKVGKLTYDFSGDDVMPGLRPTAPIPKEGVTVFPNFKGATIAVPAPLEDTAREIVGLDERPLSKGAQAILAYLETTYPESRSKTQVWVATGYAPGGGFNNLIYELTGKNLIVKQPDGKLIATSGRASDRFTPDLSIWDRKLSKGAGKIFNLLLTYSNDSYSKERIANETGYALGGGFNNLIYELTGKELIKKDGTEYIINPEILEL